MADASSIRKAATLPSATGRMASSIRFSGGEAQVATGSQWAPLGRVVLSFNTSDLPSNAAQAVWIADRAYQVVQVERSFATQSTGASLLTVKKASDGTAAASGTDMLQAGISLQGTADTVAAGTLSTTAANTQIADGQRLILMTSAATTGLAGACVTIVLRPV